MKNRNRYPDNWNEIALKVKKEANWTCQRCGLECFPTKFLKHFTSTPSERTKLTLTVHHADYDPSNNHPSNLVTLCSACHLYYHRGKKPNVDPNQLSLNLGIKSQYPKAPTLRRVPK